MFRWLVPSFVLAVIQRTVISQNINEPIKDTRIVGGSPINIDKIPYQVSLQFFGRHFCGGTLITDSFLITAAHCTVDKFVKDVTVRIGSSMHNYGGIIIPVADITNHPDYDDDVFDYDIGIIRLSKRQYYTRDFPKLPTASTEIEVTEWGFISGWGSSKRNGEFKLILRVAKVQFIHHKQCEKIYGGLFSNQMLCAGNLNEGGVDSCIGDGGGPFVINETLIGVVSWGRGCAERGYPGVYTSVSSVRQWIADITGI